jgi:hypothetical protein
MEFRKIFMKQRVYLYLLIIFLIKMISILVSGYDSNDLIDENEEYYQEYIKQYEGPITEGTQQKIEAEYERIYHNEDTDYKASSQEKAFQVIYHQYSVQKEGGYILDTRGWQTILEHDEVDYILILAIILICTILFSTEFDNDMHIILLTCKDGKYKSGNVKLWLGILSGVIVSACFQIMKYLYLWRTVGLAHGNYPLSCLEFFADTKWNCTIWQACVWIFAIRLGGAVFASLTVMAVIIFIRKTVVSLILTTSVFVASNMISGQGSAAYYMPFGMLKATGYFWPDQYTAVIDENGNWGKLCTFKEITKLQMGGYFLIFLLLIILLFLIEFYAVSRTSLPKIRIKKKRAVLTALTVVIAVSGVMGCSSAKEENAVIQIDPDEQSKYVCDDYTLEIDYENNNIIYTDDSGEQYQLIRDVLPLDYAISLIFVENDRCYYLMESDLDSGIYVRSIDMESFSDHFVYSNMDENVEDFYGLISDEKSVEEVFADTDRVNWFFVTNESIYLQKNNSILEINTITGSRKELTNKAATEEPVTYKDGKLIYTDIYGELSEAS